MVLRFFSLASIFLLASCVSIERNNPEDPGSNNYHGGTSSVTPSSNSSVEIVYGTPVTYEGETYQTVVIGTQTWFQRNLNYAAEGSKCDGGMSLVDENTASCETYGRVYDWATAMKLPSDCNFTSCASQISAKHQGICPDGWHIPSWNDWGILMKYVNPHCILGDDKCAYAGTKLKAVNRWNSVNGVPAGTDDYGFSALPGGIGFDGQLWIVGYVGYWWGSDGNEDGGLVISILYDDESVSLIYGYKNYLQSVRCLQD